MSMQFETIEFTAGDGMKLNLKHAIGHNGSKEKGPIVLVHGAGVRADIFLAPVEKTFVDYLVEHGYDVWLENWRASMDLEPNLWTLDQAAVYDHPKAVEKIIELTGAKTIKAVIHCQGSTSFMMSAVAGLIPQVDVILTNAVSLHFNIPKASNLKITMVSRLLQSLSDYINPQWANNPPNLFARLVNMAVKLTHHECDNDVCRHSSFTYGAGHPTLWMHENLNPQTHDWLSNEFGFLPTKFYAQVRKSLKNGHLQAVDSFEQLPQDFVTAPLKTGARFAFFAGKENDCFLAESQVNSFNHFNKLKPNYHSLNVIENYGHLCMFMGKDAHKDVFPHMLEALDGQAA